MNGPMQKRIGEIEDALDRLELGNATAAYVWQLAFDARYAITQAKWALRSGNIEAATRLTEKAEVAGQRLSARAQA